MIKTVYSFDPESHDFTRAVSLNDSDISPLEPGVWLIPGHCLEVAPPILPPGKKAVEQSGKWIVADIPAPVPEAPEPAAAPAPEPTDADREKARKALVQSFMDHIAENLGYDSVATAVSYADEPAVEKYQTEGRAFRAWRSIVWAYYYDLQAKVAAGTETEPSDQDLIKGLPPLSLTQPFPPPPEPAPATEASDTPTTAA